MVTLTAIGCDIWRIDGKGFAGTFEACQRQCVIYGWTIAGIFGGG